MIIHLNKDKRHARIIEGFIQTQDALKSECSKIGSEYDAPKAENAKLNSDYNTIKAGTSELQSDYDSLMTKYAALSKLAEQISKIMSTE